MLHNVVAINKAQLLISSEIMKQYEAVIAYSRFSKYKEFGTNAKDILATVKQVAFSQETNMTQTVIKDPSDN